MGCYHTMTLLIMGSLYFVFCVLTEQPDTRTTTEKTTTPSAYPPGRSTCSLAQHFSSVAHNQHTIDHITVIAVSLHTHKHTCMYTCIHVYAHAFMHIYTYACMTEHAHEHKHAMHEYSQKHYKQTYIILI